MAYDKFLIAPFESGLVNNMPPFLLPEDAWQQMNNAYVWRGRVKKRFGSRYIGQTALNSRFRIQIGTTGQAPFIAGSYGGTVPGKVFKIGQQFSIGANIYTVWQPSGLMLRTGGTATDYSYDTTSYTPGAVSFIGETDGVPVYFYPAEPVMGLCNWENGPVNDHPSFGFDTQFAYEFAGNAWGQATGSSLTPTWHSTNSRFFWTTNWLDLSLPTPLLFVTNYNASVPIPNTNTDDSMYYWDGSNWNVFAPRFQTSGTSPNFSTSPYVKTAKIILQFHDHMILLNTIENSGGTYGGTGNTNTRRHNRCRYSINGSPTAVYTGTTYPAAGSTGSFIEVNEPGYGGAGWIDAATDEAIIGAEFIKDRLIVYFERSTWELVYTGSPKPPFIWQKLNSELGTESTNSTVVFDKVVLSVGATGLHACNGINVERIDDKIPADVFNLRIDNEARTRIAGIRDYQTELVYWTWPLADQPIYADIYPKNILVYNYKNGTWSYNDDVFTAFGYFEQQTGLTWADITWKWEEWLNPWNSGVIQAQSKRIIAGNQQGFVVILDPEYGQNELAMQITNATYTGNTMTLAITDHTLAQDDYISIPTLNGITISGTGIYKVVSTDDYNTVEVDITGQIVTGVYTGGSYAARVSQIDIISKQWNPYLKTGENFTLAKIDFCVASTASGEITADYYPSSSGLSMQGEAIWTSSILGTSILETSPYVLYPLESEQDTLWHPIYFQTQGTGITLRLYLDGDQLMNPAIAFSDFELQGIILNTKQTGRLE